MKKAFVLMMALGAASAAVADSAQYKATLERDGAIRLELEDAFDPADGDIVCFFNKVKSVSGKTFRAGEENLSALSGGYIYGAEEKSLTLLFRPVHTQGHKLAAYFNSPEKGEEGEDKADAMYCANKNGSFQVKYGAPVHGGKHGDEILHYTGRWQLEQ